MLDRADETRLRIKHLFCYLDVCSCFKASGSNCFPTFSLEIHRQKHFLTVIHARSTQQLPKFRQKVTPPPPPPSERPLSSYCEEEEEKIKELLNFPHAENILNELAV